MPGEKFTLAEALAGFDPAKAKVIQEKWSDLESGFTQASQRAAEYEKAKTDWEAERGQYKSALNSFQTFFDEWNKQNPGDGTVRNGKTGRFESRKEAALPVAYDPDELEAAIEARTQARLDAFKTEMLEALGKEKAQFGTEVYTNTGQMLQWERQLQGIRRMDPEADEKLITDTARTKGLRDLNDAYFLAYGRKNLERVASEAAKKAADEAKKETEERLRKEYTQAQIEGAGALSGAASRQIRGQAGPESSKSRTEAESKAIQALTERMWSTPAA